MLTYISTYPKCERLKVCLAFADGLMIFTRGNHISMKIVCDVLRNFGNVSGCLKYNVFLEGMDDVEKSSILTFTGFSYDSMPFRYLGIPSARVYLKVTDFGPLLDKISITLES